MITKKISVEQLREWINGRLSTSEGTIESREELVVLMESILFTTNNYHGFRYLVESEIPKGQLPGIRKELVDNKTTNSFINTDKTRVYYF